MENTNSRLFKEPETSNEILFEYNKYLTNISFNKKTNFLLAVIETGDNPYIYYLMNKINNIIQFPAIYSKNMNDIDDYMENMFELSKYTYKGCIEFNDENYVLFVMTLFDNSMLPIYNKDVWWKVFPFEIINSKKVLSFKIDPLCSFFFMNHLNLLYLFNNEAMYEVPFIAFIGTGESLLNNYILLDEHHINGKYGKGYYFTSLGEAYYHSLYDNLNSTDTLLKLINNKYINDLTPTSDRLITIKSNKFYLNNLFIGDVPINCKGEFTLHNFNDDFIYLKSNISLKRCKNKRIFNLKRHEDGCILRYVLFLKKTKIVLDKKGKQFDSFCGGKTSTFKFPTYMTKYNNFTCVSYHITDKSNSIEEEFMEKDHQYVLSINIK